MFLTVFKSSRPDINALKKRESVHERILVVKIIMYAMMEAQAPLDIRKEMREVGRYQCTP